MQDSIADSAIANGIITNTNVPPLQLSGTK